MSTDSLLGIGLYSVPEAARLLGVPAPRLRRWAQGYTFGSGSTTRRSTPLIARDLEGFKDDLTLSFRDLVELYIIDLLRDKKVSMATIRASAANAEKMLRTSHPFAVRGLLTDGKKVFFNIEPEAVEGVSRERAVIELDTLQSVIEGLAREFLESLDFDPDMARRWWPLGRTARVVIDPARQFGRPVDAPTGVPTEVLYLMVEGGEEPAEVARWYEVPEEAVRDAVAFERRNTERRKAA